MRFVLYFSSLALAAIVIAALFSATKRDGLADVKAPIASPQRFGRSPALVCTSDEDCFTPLECVGQGDCTGFFKDGNFVVTSGKGTCSPGQSIFALSP